MDLKKTLLICAALCLFCCVSPALADSPTHIGMNAGTFTPLVQNGEYGIMALPVTDTISQGQTKLFSYFIPEYSERLEIILSWNRGASGNSLYLEVYDNGNSLGYFHDICDGRIDGVIPLSTTSFHKGCYWSFKVYGEDVSGIQEFSLAVNAI